MRALPLSWTQVYTSGARIYQMNPFAQFRALLVIEAGQAVIWDMKPKARALPA